MPLSIPIYQVDAFTHQVFGGNPAAVCPLQEWLPEELMQQIAMENNLSETAFYCPEDDGYRLRWFTPVSEVDLCGHATLATAHVLFNHEGFEGETLRFMTRSGLLEVKRTEEGYFMDFPADHMQAIEAPMGLFEALGAEAEEVYHGREDYLLIYDKQSTIEALAPDFRQLGQLSQVRGVIVSAPGEEVDFVSRCFFPKFGIDEDPTTGSAHTTMTPYWSKRLGKKDLTACQISERKGWLRCSDQGERVHLRGQTITFLQGTITL
ncbi:MAG: PhzF family phenazine biosynthesis protein [Bacteroidota bacterium]